MTPRPSACYGTKLQLDDIAAICDVAEHFAEDAGITPVEAHMAPWGSATIRGLALHVHGACVLIPCIGNWALGDVDPASPEVSADTAPLIAALRSMERHLRAPDDVGSRYETAHAAMRTAMDVALAYAATDAALAAAIDQGGGDALCEIGMEDDGTPIVWASTHDDDQHRLPLPEGFVSHVLTETPLHLLSQHRADFSIEGVGVPTIILTHIVNDESGELMDGRLPDPMQALRTVSHWGPAAKRRS